MWKILIVDDEKDILCVVRIILTNHHFKVEAISDWRDISDKITSYHPDLILLDVALGGADGRTICNDLKQKEITSHIPIILLSAHCDLINGLKECKPDGVLAKPFETSKLIAVIEETLSGNIHEGALV